MVGQQDLNRQHHQHQREHLYVSIKMNEAIPRPLHQPAMELEAAEPIAANNTVTTRTILRIRRRRTENPIPCIRLEGVVSNTGAATSDDPLREPFLDEGNGAPYNTEKCQRSTAVLWKRFDPSNGDTTNGIGDGSLHDDAATKKRSGEKYRIVDAMFVATEGESGEGDEDNNLRSKKRRKLTLLDSSTIADGPPASPSSSSPVKKKKRGKEFRVLDPLTRMVDDSLKEALIGEKTVESHYRQLTTDPRFTMREIETQTKWMTWSLDGGENLLHCCALWNDASITSEILKRFGASGTYSGNGNSSIRSALMEAVNDDGQTPYEIAQTIGHTRVCEVLEVYGGDTSNYVYDIFYLNQDGLVKTRPNDNGAAGDGNPFDFEEGPGITTAEMSNGIGYWTPEGELILETASNERRARSMSQETEGDIDSNCEEYGGNDYPDDEEYEDGYGGGRGADPYSNPYDGEHGYVGGNNIHDDDDGYAEYDWEQDLG